ncbi:MAG TPA: hypothetical protein VGF86_03260 [Candidatus Tumulicola sp.]
MEPGAGADLAFNEVTMGWAGMPNQNQRAAIHEPLEMPAAMGCYSRWEETWKVERIAD